MIPIMNICPGGASAKPAAGLMFLLSNWPGWAFIVNLQMMFTKCYGSIKEGKGVEDLKENYLGLAAALLKGAREDLNNKDRHIKKAGQEFLKTSLAAAIFDHFDIDIRYFMQIADFKRKRQQERLKAHN